MKRRNLGARLAVLATCISVLVALSSALGVAPAVADTNPPPGGCGCELSFTIEKLQQVAGSKRGFTNSALTAAIGDTVDYEIVVTNTSHVPMEFSNFTDANCEPGTTTGGPAVGEEILQTHSTVYTCSRKLTTGCVFTNEATVTGSSIYEGAEPPLTQTSNKVVVEIPCLSPPPPPPPPAPPVPAFTIEKRQEIAGSKAGFTTALLKGIVGETVDYQIVVTNTGNTPLKFTNFTDAQCDPATLSGGPGEGAVQPGTGTTYACSHLLASTVTVVNVASVIGSAQGAAPLSETSNPVEVTVARVEPKAICEAALASPHLPSGPKRSPFTVQVSSAGIKQITFYLDGHKLKTFSEAQAKNGKFTVKIDPRKLRYGAHSLAVKATPRQEVCARLAKASSFVDPAPPKRPRHAG